MNVEYQCIFWIFLSCLVGIIGSFFLRLLLPLSTPSPSPQKSKHCCMRPRSLLVAISTLMGLRQRLLNGGTSYGPLLLSDSPFVAELLSHVGYGHLVVDHEHSPTDLRSGQSMLQAIAGRTETVVRLPGHDVVYMKKLLDSMSLPGGVLVPMVEDADTAAAIVQSTRYPGDGGVRGCATPFVRGSSWGFNTDYLRHCREDLLVMVQVESPKGVEAIPEIAAVDGIDGIFIGPLDLSASIGKMGNFQDPEVQELLATAEARIRKSSCFLAGFRSPGRELSDMFEEGYQFVCGSIDLGLLKEAAIRDSRQGAKAQEKRKG